MDQHALARLKPRAVHQVRPDGHVHFRQAGGLDEIDALWHRQHAFDGRERIFGIAAAGQQRADRLPLFQSVHACARSWQTVPDTSMPSVSGAPDGGG